MLIPEAAYQVDEVDVGPAPVRFPCADVYANQRPTTTRQPLPPGLEQHRIGPEF